MPERQSTPGEVTTRPVTERTTGGNGHGPASQVDDSGEPGRDGLAEHVAAEPAAVEPEPTEPGNDAPTGDEPVLTGDLDAPPPDAAPAAADSAAAGAAAAPATSGQTGAVPTESTAVSTGAASAGQQQAAPAPDAPRPRPRPRPAPGPGAPGVVGEGTPVGDAARVSVPDVSDAVGEGTSVGDAARVSVPDVSDAMGEDVPGGDVTTAPAPAGQAPTVGDAGARGDGQAPEPAAPTSSGARPGIAGGRLFWERDPAAPATAITAGAPAAFRGAPMATGATAPAAIPPPARPVSAWFNVGDSEATLLIPRSPGVPAELDHPTDVIPVSAGAVPPPEHPSAPDESPRRRRGLLVLAAVVAVLALLYVGDLILSLGAVPRGVTVAGVSVGGIGFAEAEERLRSEIEPRTTRPVAVTIGEVRSEIDPRAAGLEVDWQVTLDQAGAQPLNPITRITSFFTDREVGVVTAADELAVAGVLEQLAPVVDRAPVEGTVRFEGITPVPVDPVAGQRLDVAAAADALQRDWATGKPVALPLSELAATTTPEDVATAIDSVARPAVSAPVTVLGEAGTEGTITPEVIAAALSFRAEPGGGLAPEINREVVTEALAPQLAASERPGHDASLDFGSGAPVVVPSQDGRGVDYEATLKDLLPVLTGTGPRQITAVYVDQPSELTTEELSGLGVTGMISEFTTGGFKRDSGLNIKRAAEQINGMFVKPGETFSLNGATAPRDAANGYVEAGIISDGHPSRGVGGGVSQLATTLYNAAYFAGMADVAHQEHSFYISRYPAGREATVFEDSIDLKFRNDNPTAVLIQTAWTPQSLTVRMYGTKRYEVTSTPGPRTNPTSPNTVTIPAGEPCSSNQGAPGFTITDTRTLREISTGQVRTETRTVRYNPSPIVVCGG